MENEYANNIIEQMRKDGLTYGQMLKVIRTVMEKLNKVRRVKK